MCIRDSLESQSNLADGYIVEIGPPVSEVIRRKRKLLESAIKQDGETQFMTRCGMLEYNFLSPVVAE